MLHANHIFILGAKDPERDLMEELLTQHGDAFIHATCKGVPVHAGNAYQADAYTPDPTVCPVLIECAMPGMEDAYRIDHHREGDPGYNNLPKDFWLGSSIGHLCAYLGIQLGIPHEYQVVAAMDHCFAAAVRGECPGVTPQEVLDRKVWEIAKGTDTSLEVVQRTIAFYGKELAQAPLIRIGTHMVIDLRSLSLGYGYSLDYLCTQVAAVQQSYPALLKNHDFLGGAEKWTLSGHVPPDLVARFIEVWGPANGLERLYGVATRGYAGGYNK